MPAFDWKQYLDLARDLSQPMTSDAGTREARLRSAVSRAYYAAFCHARNYSRDWLNFQPNHTADDHGRLRAFLKDGKRRGIALKLRSTAAVAQRCGLFGHHDERLGDDGHLRRQ